MVAIFNRSSLPADRSFSAAVGLTLMLTFAALQPTAWARDTGPAPVATSAIDDPPQIELTAPDEKAADEKAADEKAADEKAADEKAAETKPTRSETRRAATLRAKSNEAEKPAAKKQIRLLEMSGNYVDHVQPMGLDPTELLLGGSGGKQKSFYKLCDYLDDLAKEDAVAYIVFDLSDAALSFNPAQLEELDRRLARLKTSGKKTFAWLENPGNVQLSLAAACDQILLADFGGVDFHSVAMQSMFYRDAMDLVGVQASVVRAGNFKGAVEPYLNAQMSVHLRGHYLDMLTSINDAFVTRVARGRGLTVAQVRELQQKRLLLPAEALARRLVDRLAPYGSMKETIEGEIGAEFEWTKPKATPKREMSVFELMSLLMSGEKKSTTASAKEPTLAVLHLSGAIEDGKKASPGSVVSGPTVKAIEELIQDENIKGVVVRINSPGGSATASESIRRALEQLAAAKPTVVSMGEVAASGGYWIACIGQPIYAESGTITGSIGVFSLKLSFGTLMRRLGVHIESIALDAAAESDSFTRPWSETDVESMQSFIDDVYGKFLKLVSQSRGISLDKLDELAGGRVWSGAQAKLHGLVDDLGGLDDALTALAKKTQLGDYKVIHRPVSRSGFDLLELLGEPESNEIQLQSWLRHAGLEPLRSQGFSLQGTLALLRGATATPSRGPQAWALMPHELRFK
jgi:protease IV